MRIVNPHGQGRTGNGVRRRAASRIACGLRRVTVEFENGQPGSISIRPQASNTFNQSPSGQPLMLAGRHGVLVIIRGTDAHRLQGRAGHQDRLPWLGRGSKF